MKIHFLCRLFGLACVLSLLGLPLGAPHLAAQESFDSEGFTKSFEKARAEALYSREIVPRSDLWALMARLQTATKQTVDAQKQRRAMYDYGMFASAILQNGEEEDYQKLIQIYQALPRDWWARQVMLVPLTNYWIRRELANLEKSGVPPALKIVASDEPLPPSLQAAPPDLQNAWRQYKAVSAAFNEIFKNAAAPQIGVQSNWPLFYDIAGDFFDDKMRNTPRFSSFVWSGGCGTGSEQLYDPQYHLLFASLLKEKRYEAAIGALFPLMTQGQGLMSSLQKEDDWKQRFLRWCGLDWEALFVGAALDNQVTLSELARYGTSRGAFLLIQMSRVPETAKNADYLKAIGAFIEPSTAGRVSPPTFPQSRDFRRLSKEPISDELQQMMLQILDDQIELGKGYNIKAAAEIVTQKARLESMAALHRLLQMPYGELREKAAQTLTDMGEKTQVAPLQ